MNNETTVTVTMTKEEWDIISEAIICGICARRGEPNLAVDKDKSEQMSTIYWHKLEVSY